VRFNIRKQNVYFKHQRQLMFGEVSSCY